MVYDLLKNFYAVLFLLGIISYYLNVFGSSKDSGTQQYVDKQ
jgi:hypothetical protein